MIWKRQIPILIVAVVGAITLFGWFIDQPDIKSFVDDDATQWYDILASFAIILGALNLIKLQFQKVAKKKKYSHVHSHDAYSMPSRFSILMKSRFHEIHAIWFEVFRTTFLI